MKFDEIGLPQQNAQVAEGIIKLTMPRHRMIKRGTLRGIIKDARLTVDEFNKFL